MTMKSDRPIHFRDRGLRVSCGGRVPAFGKRGPVLYLEHRTSDIERPTSNDWSGVLGMVPGGGTDTTVLTKPETRTRDEVDPPWDVVIYNDPVNLMSYVTFVIRRVFGYGKARARRLMLEVHERGRSIVWTGNRERAEMYVEKLQSHQLLAGIEKSGD